MINSTSFKGNDVKLWVENIKNSPMHWDILMKPKLKTIYCVAHVGDNGGITFSIN